MTREVEERTAVHPKPLGEPDWHSVLAEQIRQNGPLFFNIAFGILRNRAAAEDVCQQLFLIASGRKGELRDVTQIRSWLSQIVVTQSLVIARSKKAERRVFGKQGGLLETSADSADGSVVMNESVRQALDGLPEMTRLIVILRAVHGYKGEVVKEIVGCSSKEVSVHFHRGLEMLRSKLKENWAR